MLASASRFATMLPHREERFLQQEQRRLAAILAADVAGYSRLMAATSRARWRLLRTASQAEVIEPKIVQFQGRIVGSAGDSLLVEFASAVNAVQCAVEAQEGLADRNADLRRRTGAWPSAWASIWAM